MFYNNNVHAIFPRFLKRKNVVKVKNVKNVKRGVNKKNTKRFYISAYCSIVQHIVSISISKFRYRRITSLSVGRTGRHAGRRALILIWCQASRRLVVARLGGTQARPRRPGPASQPGSGAPPARCQLSLFESDGYS